MPPPRDECATGGFRHPTSGSRSHLLLPLRASLDRGEITEGPDGLRPAPGSLFERQDPACAFARLLDAADIIRLALEHVGEGVVIGPLLMGAAAPAHLVQYGSSADEVVNLAVVGIVEAAGLRRPRQPCRSRRARRRDAVRHKRPRPARPRTLPGWPRPSLGCLDHATRSVHDQCMAVKTITIDITAYEALARRKRAGESFSDVIKAHFAAGGVGRDLLAAAERIRLEDATLDRVATAVAARKKSRARVPRV